VAAWFEDQFDVPTGWQPADSTLLDVAVEAGAFVLRPHVSSEPAYAWAPRDGALGDAAVEATITFPAGARAVAGLAVADLDFATRLVLLLGPDGAWRLQRDDAAALRTLASGRGSAPAAGVPVRLRLLVDAGTATAWLGDQRLGAAAVSMDIGHTGLATQATADGDRILVDDYRVMPVL
jgi:hypothetical protein